MLDSFFRPMALGLVLLALGPVAHAQGNIELTSSPNPAFAGVDFTLTARVVNSPATGIGNFRFRVDGNEIASCFGSATSTNPPTRTCTTSLASGRMRSRRLTRASRPQCRRRARCRSTSWRRS
jgi:hypothetical protein